MYYDVPGVNDKEDKEEPVNSDGIIDLVMDFTDRFVSSRLFEIRVLQIPFSQRAPAGCMQYFTDLEGIIQV